MRSALRRRQAVLLVVAGVVVVSGLVAVVSPALYRQDAPRQSLTAGTPPALQVAPAASNVTPLTPEVAWPMARANAANTGDAANTGYLNTIGPTSPLTVRWRFKTIGGAIVRGPVVTNGTAYFAAGARPSSDKRNEALGVYAFDAWTGEKRWKFTLAQGGIGGNTVSALAVFRDTVYVGTGTGKVHALDAATGERFWTFRAGDRITGLTVADRTLYVTSDDLYALDALTGDERWRFRMNDRTTDPAGPVSHGPPAVKDGSVYVSVNRGPLHALDAQTGAKRWTFDKATENYEFGNPSVANGLVYVSERKPRNGPDGKLYALDTNTGEQQWAFAPVGEVGGASTVVNDTLYIGVRGNGLYALDATSGSERWHVRQFTRSPLVVANAAYVEKGGSIYLLDPVNGSERGRFTPPPLKKSGGIRGKTVLNGSLYFGTYVKHSDNGILYAVGTPEFEYTDLSVTPRSPDVNESVTVTATVRNTGTGPGEFNATLGVDGTVTNATTGTLDPRTSRTVTFAHTFQEHGTYTVGIGGRTQRIGVGDVAPPPTPTATSTQATGQSGTKQSEPTPTGPAPTASPTSSTVPGFGHGVAVAAVAIVIGLLARRGWT